MSQETAFLLSLETSSSSSVGFREDLAEKNEDALLEIDVLASSGHNCPKQDLTIDKVIAENAFKLSSVNMVLSQLRVEDLCSCGIFAIVPEAELLLVRKSYP